MANIFDTAQEYYLQNPQQLLVNKKRQLLTKKLLFVLETAPFLTPSEKNQMQSLIPLYSTKVIKHVKDTLIQQGMFFLERQDNNPELRAWINKVSNKKST